MTEADKTRSEKPEAADRGDREDGDGEHVTVGESVSARIARPHKGDVGRAGTNEEIYQGSRTKELL